MESRQAFIEELYRQHAQHLRRFCRQFVGFRREYEDAVEECVQDVFVCAYRCYDELCVHPNVRAWLYKTCRYRMQDKVKMLRRHYEKNRSDDLLENLPGDENIERFVEKSSAQEDVERFFASLEARDRALLEKRYMEEESIREIADAMRMNENTVKVTLMRLRQRAKHFFGG